jgi:two-component system response regulator YesN
MNREMLLRAPGYMFRLKVMLVQLVMLLEDEIRQSGMSARPMDAASRRSVDEIARYLYDNADNAVTLEQIARHVNLNKRYICTLYRRCTGKSVMEHLRQIRISRAQRLLTRTVLSVTQIAQDTGFTSGQYFARIFKGMTGLTPGQYRSRKTNI